MAKNISVSFSNETLEKIDKYAKENGISKSGFISFCVNQYIQSQEMMKDIPSMISSLKSLSATVEELKKEKE